MSMQDPIADMLTRMRNALAVAKGSVTMSSSRIRCAILDVLKHEGFITDYQISEEGVKRSITVLLKYDQQGRPVISQLERVSRPGLRKSYKVKKLPQVKNGLGLAIVSTSKGLMTDEHARLCGLGGEVICYVS